MSSKKRLLSLIVSLAMAASVSYTPVYALDEDTIQATIEIPTGSAEGSYTYTVGSDETSTATETNSGDITTETEQAADGTDTTDSAASSDTEIAEQADTTEQTDTEEQESDAPAETTESPAETTKASAAGAASTAADTLTAEEVQELIDALPSLTELIEMDTDEANEVYTAFSAACEAYDALSADEQAEVDDSKLDDLAYYFNGMVTVAETSTVDVSSATSLTGVTTSYTRNYTAQEGTTCWDFTDVTDFNTSTLYSAGEGLYVYMNSDSSINSTYNGIYGKNWVETDTETATATQYIVFKPTEVGKLSFSAIYIGYTNSQGSGASGRVVYTTDGSVPNKGTESGTGTNSSALIISSTNQSSNGVTSDTIYNVSIEITSDDLNNTYVITAVRGSTAAYSALYDIMYTVEDTTADVSSTTTTYTTTNDISTFASAWKKTNANVNTDTDNSRIQIVSTSNSAEGSAIYPLERGSAYVITLTYKMNNSSTFGFLSSDGTTTTRTNWDNGATTRAATITIDANGNATLSDGGSSDVTATDVVALYAWSKTSSYKVSISVSETEPVTITKTTMVTGQNIDLDQGKIELNVYVDGNAVESEDDIIVSFAYAVEPATISGDSESGYTITQKVLPTQMADTLTVSCTLKNGNTHTYTTSVKQYAQEAKTLGKLKESEQDVVDAMLDYGSAVQALVTSATGDSLANGGTYQEDNINNVTATSIATKSTTGSDLDNWNGATLQNMKMNFNYNFNLGLTYTQSLEDYTITVAGDGTTTITNGTSSDSSKVVLDTDSNSIVIKGLTAAQLTSTLVITLSDGTNTYQTTTTPLYYARLLADTDTENIKGSANSPSEAQQLLGKMLYLYANAVKSLNTQTSEEE